MLTVVLSGLLGNVRLLLGWQPPGTLSIVERLSPQGYDGVTLAQDQRRSINGTCLFYDELLRYSSHTVMAAEHINSDLDDNILMI